MKKIFLIMTALLTFVACNLSCKALEEVYTNQAGATMTLEQHNKLVEIFGFAVVETMTEDRVREESAEDYTLLGETTKYIKTIYEYDIFGNIVDEEEMIITEEEYLNSNDMSTFAACNGGYRHCWETDSKKLEIKMFAGSSGRTKVVATNTWKVMPKIRSTEIMAMRFFNFTGTDGTQKGTLVYTTSESSTYMVQNYNYGDNDVQTFYNGFGATMSLPKDSNVNYIEAQIIVEGNRKSIENYGIYASYQHARRNVEPIIARQYSISASGLGGVIKIPSGVDSTNWDGMQGVSTGYGVF